MDKALRKALRVEIKDADQGLVRAVFSTLGVIDSDGDVTEAGAFQKGQAVRISAYGHSSWGGALPVGRGVIDSDEVEAWMDGEFFLSTTHGRDAFETVKAMGDLQEWSYGYDVKECSFGDHEGQRARFLKQLHVHEVSPVLVGAGVNTRTLAVKAEGASFTDEADQVLAAVTGLTERSGALAALRAKDGRGLSEAGRDRVKAVIDQLDPLRAALAELVPDPEPEPSDLARVEMLRAIRAGNL